MLKTILAACAALAMAAGAAEAKPLPAGGLTAKEIAAWMSSNGYKAKVETQDGEAYVDAETNGLNFSVDLYDCDKGRCRAVQFTVSFEKNKDTPSLQQMNDWNATKRYLKGYVSSKGDAVFQFDVNVDPGGTWEALEDDLDVFVGFMGDVTAFVKW
ncbi:YbjN domain-containing protein [Phenylobacterium sp.]|uniref:YbjN domain-containing protein n=1 Tax=Phenylobacterium sp. TaxID=1871053 RepID=UPI0025D9179A|nr:YbjN domain-containing protein [Phenylobacterium sp.]MBX3484257.1 YbjN domain-containing protein [Phenylobacterium sp.]MCW5759391.1 YbjN domain-containing protein [Phenylobacterium sp.]